MEIRVKENKFNLFDRKGILICAIGMFVSLVLVVIVLALNAANAVSKDELWIQEVRRGHIDIERSGHGKIKSSKSKWMITNTGGFVEEILKRPGEHVREGELLIALSNPELKNKIYNEQQRLLEYNEEFSILKAELISEQLRTENQINHVQSELIVATIELDAMEKLNKLGITSHIDFEKQKLLVKDSKSKLEFEKKYSEQTKYVHDSKLLAMGSKLKRQSSVIDHLLQDEINLNVTASTSGVLNQIAASVSIGKNIESNTALVEINDTSSFYAEIEISFNIAKEITVGMPATLELNNSIVKGKVSRIDPRANSGRVIIDIMVTNRFPEGTLANQPLTAKIHTKSHQNILYLDKIGLLSQPASGYYSSSIDGKFIEKPIQFKQLDTGEVVIVSSGFNEGDFIAFFKSENQGVSEFTLTSGG